MLWKHSVIIYCLTMASSALENGTGCPECPVNTLDCHYHANFHEPCWCFICMTRCYARGPVCPKGYECVTEDVYYGGSYAGQTAICKLFEQCPQTECPEECPESGFFHDINDCPTCLCNDPCKELKCAVACGMKGSHLGVDPKYSCSHPLN